VKTITFAVSSLVLAQFAFAFPVAIGPVKAASPLLSLPEPAGLACAGLALLLLARSAHRRGTKVQESPSAADPNAVSMKPGPRFELSGI
jgi:hypothetical protein